MNIKEMADYCLNCKTKPCTKGCPLGNDIPGFIQCIKENNLDKAYTILAKTTALPAICGRICPHSKQCQGNCVRGIKGTPVEIGKLEAFVGDYAIQNNIKFDKTIITKNKSVAIVGSGPAGLTAATFLAKEGYGVTILEKESYLGGLLVHGIPDFRLKKEIVENVVSNIIDLGIKINCNNESIFDLDKKFDAIILSFGSNESIPLGIDGECLDGVFGANELLKENNHPNYKNKSVVVIGGGNVAIDAARSINKLGAKKTSVIYRRNRAQMPAETKEIEDAENENIEFIFQTNPIKIHGNKYVQSIECVKTDLVKSEDGSRDFPVNIDNSNFEIDTDYIIVAIGSTTNSNILKMLDLETTSKGYVKIDENNMSSKKGIFVAGDLCGTKATVAWASRSGRDVAYSVMNYLENPN